MALDENFFIETILPRSVIRKLTDEEMNAYRAPFRTRESRLPTLVWPRELPIEGEPADVVKIVEAYGAWLAKTPIPKLFIDSNPGAIMNARAREFCRRWPNQREVAVPGVQFVQEDSPHQIGRALAEFVRNVEGQLDSSNRGSNNR